MLYQLKRHPIAIKAHFEHVLSMTYALPAGVVTQFLPTNMQPDTHNGFGFIAVAIVSVQNMRPESLPACFGGHCILAGWRVFATLRDQHGRTRRGLRILQSDTDQPAMVIGGNLLTHYNYALANIRLVQSPTNLDVSIQAADDRGSLQVTADISQTADDSLPPGSPFESHAQARRFAGPLPYTFDYEPQTGSVIMIKGVRERWHPRPVPVDIRRNTFFQSGIFRDALAGVQPILASAFHISDVDYRWSPGRLLTPMEPTK